MTDEHSPSRRALLQAPVALGLGGLLADAATAAAPAPGSPRRWSREADVIVVGSGATGMSAAIVAREAGASVLLVEAEPHFGGHAILSGGHVALGGGTSAQRRHGIQDSPDLLFADLTDWSIVEPNGFPDYRYNDREILRAFADHNVETYEWLLAHGVRFVDGAPDSFAGGSVGNSAPRQNHAAACDWVLVQTGEQVAPAERLTYSTGNGVMQPLEASARRLGVQILFEHRMTALHRADGGRIDGIAVRTAKGETLNLRARRGVVIATGGSTGNVNFRRMADPRLTEEYCGNAGHPWSVQDASGELAAMQVGASLWGMYNQSGEFGAVLNKPGRIGCQYGYANLEWGTGSRVFDRVRATGLKVADWQNLILVNMIGRRFYDETGRGFTSNNNGALKDYVPGSWLNARNVKYSPNNFINAALAGIGDGHNGGGPIWAIFDSEALAREQWSLAAPNVDREQGFFFEADTLAELAAKIVMKHQRVPMPAANLEATVTRYNAFVDSGVDADFGKPKPLHRIARAPFYAAWATPVIHDTRSGLRIDARCRVIDFNGAPIPGLYCGGESAGGFSQHGLGRAIVQGRIAGRAAAQDRAA